MDIFAFFDLISLYLYHFDKRFIFMLTKLDVSFWANISLLITLSYCMANDAGPHSETGRACFYSQPGANRPLPVDFFRILRVVYLKPIGDLLVDLPVIGPLYYETFTPELVKCKELTTSQRERVEKMKETFNKVTAFLQTSGLRLPLLLVIWLNSDIGNVIYMKGRQLLQSFFLVDFFYTIYVLFETGISLQRSYKTYIFTLPLYITW